VLKVKSRAVAIASTQSEKVVANTFAKKNKKSVEKRLTNSTEYDII
jgi:hypothetical protein